MKQLTLAAVGFERYAKTTRRATFLAEMERVVPWLALCGLIASMRRSTAVCCSQNTSNGGAREPLQKAIGQ